MARKYELHLVTPEGEKYAGRVEYARLPGADGYFGVMAGHAPLIAALVPGELVITEDEKRTGQEWACGPGVAEVRDSRLVVLVQTAEPGTEIDLARAREAAARARERLAEAAGKGDVDLQRAEGALARAVARLKVGGKVQLHL